MGLINYHTRGPQFGGSYPVSIEIFVEQRDAKDFYSTTIVDREACTRIMRALVDARSANLHDSPEIGWFIVHYADGSTNQIYLLPGHNADRYGIRWGTGDFALSKKHFYAVLRDAGVDTTKIPDGER